MPDLHVPCADYGIWTDHRIPDDRSGWHPAARAFYEYWLAITPPGRLPGRQHIKPEDIAPLLSRVWLADVYRDPLRLRFRLTGTAAVQSFGREVTGHWLDEVQPVGSATRMCMSGSVLRWKRAVRPGVTVLAFGTATQNIAASKTAMYPWPRMAETLI